MKIKQEKEEQRNTALQIFARNLKKYREIQGFNKNQFAKLCGMLSPNYSRYEAGVQEPGAIMAIQIASLLGVTVEDLFEDNNDTTIDANICLAWFEARGMETSYDGDNTIAVIADGLPAYILTLEQAKTIITNAETTIEPSLKAAALAETLKATTKARKK